MPQENNVRAVERALHIINCFIDRKEGLSLVEIAKMIELTPSTTLRLIGTLQRENYLFRDPHDLRYYLGFKLVRIGNSALDNMDIARIAHPYLEKLVDEFGESTGLYQRQGNRRVCVDRVDGTKALRSIVQVGNSAPLTRGASGRLLFSELSDDLILSELEKDPFCTLLEIRQTRKDGYAISFGEREKGVVSMAAPIYNSLGRIAAVLFVTGPESRIDQQIIGQILPRILSYAHAISGSIGYEADNH